jgi:hypothetical protein
MRFLNPAIRLLRENQRPYVLLNALAYGLVLLGMALGALFPSLHSASLADMDSNGSTTLASGLLATPLLFALVIFAINVLTVVVASIGVPSMIVPFAGISVFAVRALTIGVSLAPVDRAVRTTLIPHSLTLLIEVQAYVLVMLGAFVLGRAWLRPASVGAEHRRDGYVRGLRSLGRLLVPALVLLVIGALYEAFSLAYLVPLMLGR